jgi:hypothetical protein
MRAETPSQSTTFGYLSTLESSEHGYFGGYLIVTALGRPLEFHCTAPVRPSRAQQILYGPTLHPYLHEQIGRKLLATAKLTPCLILTDLHATVSLRPHQKVPMAVIRTHETSSFHPEFGTTDHADASNAVSNSSVDAARTNSAVISLGTYDVQLPPGYESEQRVVFELLTVLAEYVDPGEPFGRIHDAIREAQRISGQSDEYHGQAA